MIIYQQDATVRSKDEIEIRNYITKSTSSSFSLAVTTLDGLHPNTLNTVSDRAYLVIDGVGTVRVGDKEGTVQAGDAVYIPRNTVHSIEGRIKYAVVNVPPYESSNEVKP